MPDITYDSLKPIISSEDQEGSSMRVVFRCPATGKEVPSSATIRQGRSLADTAKKSAKRSAINSARRAVGRLVRSVVGGGMLGRMARDVTRDATSRASRAANQTFSSAEKQAAVVDAFERVSSQFMWDAKNNRWISVDAAQDLPEFTQVLGKSPVTEKYDRGVLARMLCEVAGADGQLAEDEKQFLADFIDSDIGTVADLMNRPPLNATELSETNADVRDTLFMVAWALAVTDESLADAETQKLSTFQQGLGLDANRATELQQYAKHFVLDQAFAEAYSGGQVNQDAHAQAMQLAEQIGMSAEEAQRVDIRFRKRNGIV